MARESGTTSGDLTAALAQHLPAVGRPLLVAVDGPDGAGKTWLADQLAEGLPDALGRPVVRASVDDFHFPRTHRHALGRTGETVWSRSYDYRTLRRELLDPWLAGAGSSYRRRWHDLTSDSQVEEAAEEVIAGSVLVVDGVFVQRAELRDVWDLAIYVDCPHEVRAARMAARDGTSPDAGHPDHERYVAAQRIYHATCLPRETADVVIDTTDPEAPRIVASDLPEGWRRESGHLVREVRLADGDIERARRINRLL